MFPVQKLMGVQQHLLEHSAPEIERAFEGVKPHHWLTPEAQARIGATFNFTGDKSLETFLPRLEKATRLLGFLQDLPFVKELCQDDLIILTDLHAKACTKVNRHFYDLLHGLHPKKSTVGEAIEKNELSLTEVFEDTLGKINEEYEPYAATLEPHIKLTPMVNKRRQEVHQIMAAHSEMQEMLEGLSDKMRLALEDWCDLLNTHQKSEDVLKKVFANERTPYNFNFSKMMKALEKQGMVVTKNDYGVSARKINGKLYFNIPEAVLKGEDKDLQAQILFGLKKLFYLKHLPAQENLLETLHTPSAEGFEKNAYQGMLNYHQILRQINPDIKAAALASEHNFLALVSDIADEPMLKKWAASGALDDFAQLNYTSTAYFPEYNLILEKIRQAPDVHSSETVSKNLVLHAYINALEHDMLGRDLVLRTALLHPTLSAQQAWDAAHHFQYRYTEQVANTDLFNQLVEAGKARKQIDWAYHNKQLEEIWAKIHGQAA